MGEEPEEWDKCGRKDALNEIIWCIPFIWEIFEVEEMDENSDNAPEEKWDESLFKTFFEKGFRVVAVAVVDEGGAGDHKKDRYSAAANRLNYDSCVPANIWRIGIE